MTITRSSVESSLNFIPCLHQWWIFSWPTFALAGLTVAWLTGRNKLYGAGLGGALGYLISWYGSEKPYSSAGEVSPALLAMATAAGEAARAAQEAATNASRAERGVLPSSSARVAASAVPVARPPDAARQSITRQSLVHQANVDLANYCQGPRDRRTGIRGVSEHAQECAAGGWRETVPGFQCFRAPSFQY